MQKLETDALARPWGAHAIPRDESLAVELGPLLLRVRRRADEIWLAPAPGDWSGTRRPRDSASSADEEEWTRWPVPEGTDGIRLAPVFPPRPVVVHPEHPFRLLPGTRARIFVRIPLWVRVETDDSDPKTLTEVPTVVLSDTWWGSFTEGELGFWLPTTARRRVPREVFAPHLAVCPLRLVNQSDEELPVETIAFQVAHLTLFSDEGRFWGDESRVRYRGRDEESRIDMSGKPPGEAPGAVRVAAPREPPPRGLRAKSMARLRALPGLDGL